MEDKEQLLKNITEWVNIDNKLKYISEKIKPLREKKTELSREITEYYKTNNLESKKININGNSLNLYEKKEYSALTYSYIEKCLGDIITDKKHIDYIISYLKEHREIKTVTDIRRSYSRRSTNKNRSIDDSENI
jgi:aldehyde:ferredoxin oxidoreductase